MSDAGTCVQRRSDVQKRQPPVFFFFLFLRGGGGVWTKSKGVRVGYRLDEASRESQLLSFGYTTGTDVLHVFGRLCASPRDLLWFKVFFCFLFFFWGKKKIYPVMLEKKEKVDKQSGDTCFVHCPRTADFFFWFQWRFG